MVFYGISNFSSISASSQLQYITKRGARMIALDSRLRFKASIQGFHSQTDDPVARTLPLILRPLELVLYGLTIFLRIFVLTLEPSSPGNHGKARVGTVEFEIGFIAEHSMILFLTHILKCS